MSFNSAAMANRPRVDQVGSGRKVVRALYKLALDNFLTGLSRFWRFESKFVFFFFENSSWEHVDFVGNKFST